MRRHIELITGIEELKGFDPQRLFDEIAPDIRAAILICQKDGAGIAALADHMEADEGAALVLLDGLAEAQRRLAALGAMVANAEQRLLCAFAD